MSLNSWQSLPLPLADKLSSRCEYQINNELSNSVLSSLDMTRWSNDVEVMEAITMLREVKEKFWDLQQMVVANEQTTDMIKNSSAPLKIGQSSSTRNASNDNRCFSFEPKSQSEQLEVKREISNLGCNGKLTMLNRRRIDMGGNGKCAKFDKEMPNVIGLTSSPKTYNRLIITSEKNNDRKNSSKSDIVTKDEVKQRSNGLLLQNSDRFEDDDNLDLVSGPKRALLVSGPKTKRVSLQSKTIRHCTCERECVYQYCPEKRACVPSQRNAILSEASAFIEQNVARPQYLLDLIRLLQRLKTSDQLTRAVSDIKRIARENSDHVATKQEEGISRVSSQRKYTHSNTSSDRPDRRNPVIHTSEEEPCVGARPDIVRTRKTDSEASETVLEFTDIWTDNPNDVSLHQHTPHSSHKTSAPFDAYLHSPSTATNFTNQRKYMPQYNTCRDDTILISSRPTTTNDQSLEMSEFYQSGCGPLTSLTRTDIAKRMESEFQGDGQSAISFLMFSAEPELVGDGDILPLPGGR